MVLSGDLYHFRENRTLKHVPTFNFDEAEILGSIDAVEDFPMESGARLWMEHHIAANALLDKSPANTSRAATPSLVRADALRTSASSGRAPTR